VVLSSVLESRAVTLVSCYLADLGDPAAVSHMCLARGQLPAVAQRVLGGLPGQSHARACLLDHAAELRDALGSCSTTSRSASSSPTKRPSARVRVASRKVAATNSCQPMLRGAGPSPRAAEPRTSTALSPSCLSVEAVLARWGRLSNGVKMANNSSTNAR
jgi:hypothetical protein